MGKLVLSVIALAVVDSVNPTSIAAQMLLLSLPRPLPRAVAFVTGVFLTYLVCGVLLLVGLDRLFDELLLHPPASVYAAQIALGLVLCALALRVRRGAGASLLEQRLRASAYGSAFLLGVGATLGDLTTALPYVVAVGRIVHVAPGPLAAGGLLVLYDAIYATPLLALAALTLALREEAGPAFARLGPRVRSWGPRLAAGFVALVGLTLVADGVAFFVARPFL